jgi:glycosyltransferase involved in cell wall biosynthesis
MTMAIDENKEFRVAFIHDWLVTYGGGEQILRALMEVWDGAPVYTLIHDPDGPCSEFTKGKEIITSFIQKLPRANKNHRFYLPLMPFAIEQFDLRGHDVVISISHAVSHGIVPQPDQLHINYICIPIRYAWHLYHQYLEEAGLEKGMRSLIAKSILHYIRLWDISTSQRIDHYVAISNWVARNVWRVYRRKADVIYPPVDIQAFTLCEQKENFYLTVSRLVPYKKIDLIIEAFNMMPQKKLFVIGDGPELIKLQAKAGKNVEFLGFKPLSDLVNYMQRARAFIFAALEDFGIVPVEAQACGTPVIAYGNGGVLETVIEKETGLFFPQQNAQSLITAVQAFENNDQKFKAANIRKNAERFNKGLFQKEFGNYIDQKWTKYKAEN